MYPPWVPELSFTRIRNKNRNFESKMNLNWNRCSIYQQVYRNIKIGNKSQKRLKKRMREKNKVRKRIKRNEERNERVKKEI